MKISNNEKVEFLPNMANRHGFIAGATGTGKTVSLKLLAEQFSEIGVPVFLADVKGDISGMASVNLPVTFWDVYNETGVPFHSDVSRYSPLLLARLLSLSESQASILSIILYKFKDINTIPTLARLKQILVAVRDAETNFTKVSINTLIRKVETLQVEGGDMFFEGTALDINDLFKVKDGKGVINILDATKLIHKPELYATSLMWLLQEMYETLPEVGDLEKPKMVFFFDEAHLLFVDSPKILIKTIEKIIRLIRSKGVGVYFITQSPKDIPDNVLAQLGNRIQHALRAYTPKEMQAVKTAATTFRENINFSTEETITQLGTGEALVSLLDTKGAPTMVEKVKINAPISLKGGVIDEEVRKVINENEPLNEKYLTSIIICDNNTEEKTAFDWGKIWEGVMAINYFLIIVLAGIMKLFECVLGGNTGRRRR